jgi:hypothetical protein
MRAPVVVGGVLLVLGLATPVAAQDGSVSLTRIIDFSMPVRVAVSDCTVPRIFAGLVRRFELVAGVEYLRSPCAKIGGERPSNGPFVDLRGLTLEEAFARLLAMDPRYRIVDHDGVLVMRPVQAWTDRSNMLNFTTPSFIVEDATLGVALETVTAAMAGENPWLQRFPSTTEQSARRFTVKTRATSAVATLEAIVRAHGAAWWEVREGEKWRVISFYTFDGSGIGSSRRGFQ